MTRDETTPAAAPLLVLVLFGPMQILVHGRPIPQLRSRKAQWLLALLALRSGRAVERSWLAGTLWPEMEQSQALRNLRPVLSDLRKALADQGERLRFPNQHSLYLELAGADVDVVAFDAIIGGPSTGDFEAGVALYSGALLEGCTEEWIFQERAEREQACLKALLALANAATDAGKYDVAAQHFRRAVAVDPWSDAVRRGLMDTLVRSGDRNGAMQAYTEFSSFLRSSGGGLPDDPTRELYARLRSEARLAASAPASQRPGSPIKGATSAPPVVTGHLPHPLTDLIGREDEREEVGERLQRSRLVSLTGPGGIGKTRLALAIANDVVQAYPDGVWLAPLEDLVDGDRVAPKVASVLGVKEEPNQPLVESLIRHLRPRRLLLVLDNCEHVADASARLVGRLLQECAGLRILATSRVALGITGEVKFPVPALSVPNPLHLPERGASLVRVLLSYDGVRLFVERAQAVQKDFAVTQGDGPFLAQICARLEGMPLALEMAAARVRMMTLSQMAARLDDALGLLTDGSRTALSRQQTLRATIDWPYALLGEQERLLLCRLSVFSGGWTLEAAESICAGDGIEGSRILDLLTRLVDKSMVVFSAEPLKPRAQSRGRYRLRETVRQFAAERLGSGSEAAKVRVAHRNWLLALALEYEAGSFGPEQGALMHRLDDECDNFRATLASDCESYIDPEADLILLGAIWNFWETRGLYGLILCLNFLRSGVIFLHQSVRRLVLSLAFL